MPYDKFEVFLRTRDVKSTVGTSTNTIRTYCIACIEFNEPYANEKIELLALIMYNKHECFLRKIYLSKYLISVVL